jgi:hypothetical protein
MMVDALANLVSAAHLAYFVFMVGGFLATVIGIRKHWDWIRNPWFRGLHFLSVWFVLLEPWIGIKDCPLNVAEHGLRTSSEGTVEAGSGLGYVLDRLLFHTISGRVLTGTYWAIGILLVILLFIAPPRWRTGQSARA